MSDIRKIQTGSNQYTLHARVSDKLVTMCSSKTRNNTNYPFHRILKTDVYSNNAWTNHGITLYLSGHYASPSARFGIVDIEFSQNGTGNSAAKITWIVRSGFEIDDVQAGLFAPANGTYIDVYLKTRTAYDGVAVKCISEGDWDVDNLTYKFVNSEEVNNTTASNKLASYEVYKTIEEAATQLHGKAYTSIIKPTDSGTVANAGYAEKIGTNKSHPQIGSPTKPVYVDSSGDVQACTREIPNIPYSVTKIIQCTIGDFCYDIIYPYDGPGAIDLVRVFIFEPGDKIIVRTTGDGYLRESVGFVNRDGSLLLEVKVNTLVTVNEHVECVLRSWYHNALPEGYVEIYRNNSTATDTFRLISDEFNLSEELASVLYVKNTGYPIYRYKGSVDSLSNLTSPDHLNWENAGEVYKILTASTNNSITTNPGDYVVFVWDETKNAGHWDNLSGTVENAGYAEKIGTDKSHPQIGSPTKPVYVDSNGLVKACSRDIPTGMTIDSVLNDTSVNAVLNKVINAALKGKNPKAKADFIASSDLTSLPITAGVLDLNGYTLTLSGTTLLTGTLTIKNGTIGGEGTLQTDLLIFVNDCDLIVSSKINLSSTISILDNIHVKDAMSNFFILNVGEDYYATISPSAYCLITNFSGITIEGTNTNYNIIAQNGNNLLARNAKIKVLNVSAVEFLGKFDADIYNCQNIRFDSSLVDKSSTYTISFSTVETGTGQSFVRYGFKDQNGVIGDSLKPNDIIDASNHSVITSKAVVDYLQNYAKKSDISAVYKYKGTKTNYSELTTSGNTVGDVWNITNADATNGIKAGDNVVWDGSKWDNLSGTVENAGYAEKIGTDKSHPQIGSPTKPVYVDSSGLVKACSRDIPTGMTIDSVLNDTSVNAVLNKVINAALKGKNPKAKADFIASSDLTALPITAGVLDLNGYTLTLSGTTLLTGTLTIKNGTIGGEGTLLSIKEDDESSISNFIYINDCKLINLMQLNLYSYIAILNNVHGTTGKLDGDTSKYANLGFMFFGYITNFSNISVKNTNLELINNDDIQNLVLTNGCWMKIENANVLIRSSLRIEFYGMIKATMFSCSDVNILDYEMPSHNPDLRSTFKLYSCSAPGKSDLIYFNYGYKYYNKENSCWEKGDLLDEFVYSSNIETVCRYNGTVASYLELPDADKYSKYDIYTITNADATHNIKAGDSVICDGKKWINLSGNLSDYLKKGGKQTTTSTADGGSNVYTFTDGSTITVKNGSKGSTGAAATWFSGSAVTGTSTTAKTFTVSGSKAGDMYLNTGTSNVYKATAANLWVYLCNIKGPQGTPGNNGTTPTIKAAAGGNIGTVGTPSVTANTSGTTTTFTFNNLKGQKGDTGATVTWHTGTAVTGTAATVAGAKTGDMYLNTKTYNVYKSTGTNKWVGVCNIKGANGTTPIIKAAAGSNINSVGTPTVSATTSGATTTFTFNNLKGLKGDAADIPKLAKGVAGIVPGTTDDSLNASRWLNGGDNGTGKWRPLPTAAGGTSGMVRTCKDYTGSINRDDIKGYAHGTTPPTILPITSGASDYRGVESDGSGRLFVNVPAYEKNINRAQNTVLAAPTTGTGTATFRKLTTSDIPWSDKLKVVTESQFNSTTPTAGVFYFVLEE